MQSHSHSLNIHGQVQFFSYPGMETVHFLVIMMTLENVYVYVYNVACILPIL